MRGAKPRQHRAAEGVFIEQETNDLRVHLPHVLDEQEGDTSAGHAGQLLFQVLCSRGGGVWGDIGVRDSS